jgi:hypothetical protein
MMTMGVVNSTAGRARLALCTLLIFAFSPLVSAQSLDDQYQLLRQNLIASFSIQKLVPIITPRGEGVGDAYDISDFTLLSRGAECFPGLVVPKAVPTTLPGVVNVGELDVSLAVGAPELADVRAEFGGSRAIEIRYREPTVQAVSVMELQKAFSSANCRSLEPIVNGKFAQQIGSGWPLIVAEVYYAKREVVIASGDKAGGEVSLSGLSKLLESIKANISASVGADYAKTKQITLTSTVAVPVAVRPAFLPRKFTGRSLGATPGGESTVEGAQWSIFAPAAKPSQNALFDQLMAGDACTSLSCFERKQ